MVIFWTVHVCVHFLSEIFFKQPVHTWWRQESLSGQSLTRSACTHYQHPPIHRASIDDSDWEPWSEELELDTVSAVLTFGLYSVMITVTLLTVTSRVCAVLRSTFFSLGGWRRCFSNFLSFFSRFWLLVAGRNWVATCCATNWGLIRGLRVDVPFRTSHIRHLNASAVFRNVHTLQSQKLSSRTLAARFARRIGLFLWSIEATNTTRLFFRGDMTTTVHLRRHLRRHFHLTATATEDRVVQSQKTATAQRSQAAIRVMRMLCMAEGSTLSELFSSLRLDFKTYP